MTWTTVGAAAFLAFVAGAFANEWARARDDVDDDRPDQEGN